MEENQHEVEDENQENVQQQEQEKDNQFGFTPLEDPNDKIDQAKKRKREEDSEEIDFIKRKINRLLCRYPTLKPRSSSAFMEKLDNLDLEHLMNIYENMINDLSAIRGFPTADTAIITATYYPTMYVRGYMQRCLKDEELRRDIDTEISNLIGHGHNWLIILFRFFNNLVKCMIPEHMTIKTYDTNTSVLYPEQQTSPLASQYVQEIDINNGNHGEQRKDQQNNHQRIRSSSGDHSSSG